MMQRTWACSSSALREHVPDPPNVRGCSRSFMASPAKPPRHADHSPKGKIAPLTLAALGVVFGDIGTSPLYTINACVNADKGIAMTRENVLGILSLIVYALIVVVAIKYLGFIMKADNEGEGGILALLALVPDRMRASSKGNVGWVTVVVLFGRSPRTHA